MIAQCLLPVVLPDVCRPSSTISFKHLLLLNHSANLDETWRGCSSYSRDLIPCLSLVAVATERKEIAKSLKIISSESRRRRALIFCVCHLLVESTEFVHMMPLWSKLALPTGS